MTTRVLPLAALVLCAAVLLPATGAAAETVVVQSRLKAMDWPTATYASSAGTYRVTWIGPKRYRLSGTIRGRRLTGTIRTRQARSGDRYVASGSGRYGGRAVRLGGGGPNSLKTARLVLRW